MIRVLLIDDHTLVRNSVRLILEHSKSIQIIGETGTGVEGVQLTRQLQPDVVLLDFKLPDITGLEVTARLLRLQPAPKILLLSSATQVELVLRLLEAGALGFLTKEASPEELLNAIKAVNKGERILTSAIASRLALVKVDAQSHTVFNALTNKEMEVLISSIRGISTHEIALRLHMSLKTIHSYRSRIFQKLGVDNEVTLMLLAIREGLMTPEEIDY